MTYRRLTDLPSWEVRLLALWFFVDTLVRAVWRRREQGWRGLLLYPWFVLKYFSVTAVTCWRLGPRARIVHSAYGWLRRIDDIMDEEAQSPKGFTRSAYLMQKQRLIDSLACLHEYDGIFWWEDVLLIHIEQECQRFGIDVMRQIRMLWQVMCWDAQRRGSESLPMRREMENYAARQDKAILGFCVEIIGGDTPRFYEMLSGFAGIFTRTDWLFDMPNDIAHGLVNIPQEEIWEYGLDVDELLKCRTWDELMAVPNFRAWYDDEAAVLELQWDFMRHDFGYDLAGLFPTQLGFIVEPLIVREFGGVVDQLVARAS